MSYLSIVLDKLAKFFRGYFFGSVYIGLLHVLCVYFLHAVAAVIILMPRHGDWQLDAAGIGGV